MVFFHHCKLIMSEKLTVDKAISANKELSHHSKKGDQTTNCVTAALLVTSLASAALLKQQKYSVALRLYQCGGGGLNLYKYCDKQAKPLRKFAIDYHPIWDKKSQANIYRLHYHRGNNFHQIKKHRPYQGGW